MSIRFQTTTKTYARFLTPRGEMVIEKKEVEGRVRLSLSEVDPLNIGYGIPPEKVEEYLDRYLKILGDLEEEHRQKRIALQKEYYWEG